MVNNKQYGIMIKILCSLFRSLNFHTVRVPLLHSQLTGTRGYPPPMLRLRSPPVDPPPSAEVMADARNSSIPLM